MKLTANYFTLLAILTRHASQLVPRETLLLLVWGTGKEFAPGL
jgi:DNA-binding response OmpR family regulator